jgi:hypothetical protein
MQEKYSKIIHHLLKTPDTSFRGSGVALGETAVRDVTTLKTRRHIAMGNIYTRAVKRRDGGRSPWHATTGLLR